jgi:glycosyltransferase involved in cell wall biosynthesis
MRIVIDLQSCQHADSAPARAALALAQQMVRKAGDHTLWIAFSNQFPARLALLRAAFDSLLPVERVLVYDTPTPDGSARVQRMIELIRDNFFAALGADLVLAPSLFDGPFDPVGTIAEPPRPFLTAVGVAREARPGQEGAGHHGALLRADLLLAASPSIAAGLRATPAAPPVVDIGASLEQSAQAAWHAIGQLVRERPAAPAPATRPTLAYVAPLQRQSGVGDQVAGLLAELARFYDIHLIVPPLPAPGLGQGEAFPVHDLAWFERHAARFDRIVYQVGNSDVHAGMLGLLARHPGIVDLHDFFLGEVVQAQERDAGVAQALRKALFYSHGYGAVAEHAAAGALAVGRKYPVNKAVLDAAAGVIVHAAAMAGLADAWYGDGSSEHWRIVALPDANPAHPVERDAAARAGRDYANAIEAFSRSSPAAHYQALLRAIRGLGAPSDPRHPELIAAAQAIAANQPPRRPRQLLVDVSAMVQLDMKTGISRVVRSILLSLIETPPPGYRLEPVYVDGVSGRYRYARQFTFALTGSERVEVEDAPIGHRPGDVFLGLDLAPGATTHNAALLADMRNHGIALHFVVYDMLPLLQPEAFAYGSTPYFQRHIETIAQQADSLVCISRAVADELADWLGSHPPPRTAPLRIGYFHLGADLAASAPSMGLAADAQHVFDRVAQGPTLLMVGTVEPRKGHEQALAACELLWSDAVDVNLVIVGKPGWLVERLIKKIEKHPRLGKNLFWLPGASDEMLTRLYESCAALLAASKGEGFGLPLIEAARHGLPIIARDLPVFREVGGEHAFYFNGTDAAALARAIRDWLALRAAGQVPPSSGMSWLSWAQSTQQLLAALFGRECYRSVAGVRPAVQTRH